jgi:hypothetical protein
MGASVQEHGLTKPELQHDQDHETLQLTGVSGRCIFIVGPSGTALIL